MLYFIKNQVAHYFEKKSRELILNYKVTSKQLFRFILKAKIYILYRRKIGYLLFNLLYRVITLFEIHLHIYICVLHMCITYVSYNESTYLNMDVYYKNEE